LPLLKRDGNCGGRSPTTLIQESSVHLKNRDTAKGSPAGLPVRYLLVCWLLVLSAIAFVDRTNISIAGVQISREFRLDNTQLGWIFSAFLIGYALFQVPGGIVSEKFGARRVLAFSVIWWGLFTVLTAVIPAGFAGGLAILILIRFLLGAGEATMYPAANRFVERWFPLQERGKANGIIFGGVGLGSGVTPPLVTAIMLRFGWRASFWFSALLGIVAGVVWYLVSRDTPEEHRSVASPELRHILAGREQGIGQAPLQANAAGAHAPLPWMRIFTSREVLGLSVSYFAFGYIAWIFFSWFYIYLVQVRGLNLRATAIYSIFPFIAMTVGCLLGGIASDWVATRYSRRAGRSVLPAVALAGTAVLLVVGSRAQDARTASAVLACGAGCLYLSQSCFWSVSADFGGEHSGVVSGVMNFACQIGGAVTASLTPFLASHFGWNTSFAAATLLALVGAIAWLFVDPDRRLATGMDDAGRPAPAPEISSRYVS
jgi:ACS family glucarate transporter-like MFS transporter